MQCCQTGDFYVQLSANQKQPQQLTICIVYLRATQLWNISTKAVNASSVNRGVVCMKHMSIKIYRTPRRGACGTNQWSTLSCCRRRVAATLTPPMWQMYDVRFKVYTSPVHKPVTSARYTDIQPQHTISLDIKSIPFFSITPRDSETCTQAIIKSWWGWHLTSVLILSCFQLSFFLSFCVWRNGNEPWQLLRSRL